MGWWSYLISLYIVLEVFVIFVKASRLCVDCSCCCGYCDISDSFTMAYKPSASDDFPALSKHNNLLAKVLTKEMYAKYHGKQTSNGVTMDANIQTGVDNPGHPFITTVGATAGDEESYAVFRDLFDGLIEKRHGFSPTASHKTDLDSSKLTKDNVDPTGEFVISTRVRTGRSIRDFRLPPSCSRGERRKLAEITKKAVLSLEGDLAGEWHELSTMDKELREKLIKDHILFQEPDSPLLLSSGMGRDWPDARAVFFSSDKKFITWVNEEDHLRLISLSDGGNLKDVFERFSRGVTEMEKAMKASGHQFMHNTHLGYILTCPSNLGTGLRASVMIKIPKLTAHPKFQEIFKPMRLQRRGTLGVDSTSTDGTHDISNSDRLGYSEVELCNVLIEGLDKIISWEKTLKDGGNVDAEIDNVLSGKCAG
eukprot:GHVS01007610.1.p1 GENE.GHVS01007610.1~~GHVS01007610.1.p1  ORF type:complete len:423 (+),score=77.94 GHVS01007610.1:56-1324(+)